MSMAYLFQEKKETNKDYKEHIEEVCEAIKQQGRLLADHHKLAQNATEAYTIETGRVYAGGNPVPNDEDTTEATYDIKQTVNAC